MEGLWIVSDRHQSIHNMATKWYPNTLLGYYNYHLTQNVKNRFPRHATELKSNFKAAWKAYDPETFVFNMEQLHKINQEIQAYLERIELQKWARAFSPKPRYGVMTSNIAESMNNKNKEAREIQLTALMEWLRSIFQTWFFQRRKQ